MATTPGSSSPKMMEMGVKRKDAYPAETSSPKDYDNEIIRPGITLNGDQAKKMGADDLKTGEYVKQTVIWKVKGVTITDKDGEKDYRLELDLCKASDLEEVDEDEAEDESSPGDAKEDAAEGDEPSPGLAYILGGKSAD